MPPILLAGIYLLTTIMSVDLALRLAVVLRRRVTAGGPAEAQENPAAFLIGLIPPATGIAAAGAFALTVPGLQLGQYLWGTNAIASFQLGMVVAGICCSIAIGLSVLLRLISSSLPPLAEMRVRVTTFVLVAIDLLISAAFEEIVFRGQLLLCLLQATQETLAVLLSAVIFAGMHLWKHQNAPAVWTLNTLLFGILAAELFLITDSLAACIALHFVWNLVETPVLGLPANGYDYNQGLLTSRVSGPSIMTGGDWSLDAGLVATLALMSAGALLLVLR